MESKTLIVNLNFNHHCSLTESEALYKITRELKKSYNDELIDSEITNICLDCKDWDVREVVGEIFKDISKVLNDYRLSKVCIEELDKIYKKHAKYIKTLK